ncbi:MAG: hypothetical protein JG781_686 [Peptococcaceae bacterium]|jgi:hypothetical protein|nr:hypothetical protein [Peptococcaceae bacterium]
MLKQDLAEIWPDILCLIPFYDTNGGNSTQMLLEEGKELVIQRRTKTVVKDLARIFAVDVAAMKERCGPYLGRKSSTPLPLRPDFILLPVKMRVPLAKDEGAWGYVVLQKIEACGKLAEGQSQIIFRNGTKIKCLQKVSSIRLLMAQAQLLKSQLNHIFYYTVREEEMCLREPYSCQALRTLLKEIIR